MNPISERRLLRWGILLACLLTIAGLQAYYTTTAAQGWLQISTRLQLILWSGVAWSAVLAVVTLLAWFDGTERLIGWMKQFAGQLSRLGWLLPLLSLVLVAAFPVLMYTPSGLYLSQNWTRQAVFLWLWAALTFSLVAFSHKPWTYMAALAGLSMAAFYHLTTYLPHISNYPFGLWWSETTRYYLASTFLGEQFYGQDLPWTMKDMTRYLIQAVPFLVPGAPLWLHRLWQVILRFFCGYLTGYVLARRLKIPSALPVGLFTLWAGLFFFQGPVFYHLIVVVILVVWLADIDRFWQTLAVVAAVSIYAGFSRINWIPMPGLIAAVFYFAEKPVGGRDLKHIARYLALPAVWVVAGVAIGMATQQFWAVYSGNPPEIYLSSFTSYMLWDRLLPNPSYPYGVLPLTLAVSAPLLVYLGIGLQAWKKKHWVRVLAVVGITAGLFVGGMIVSVKIGGGTNLHNMDVFFVILLILAVEFYYGRWIDERSQAVQVSSPPGLTIMAVVFPILYLLTFFIPINESLESEAVSQELEKLQRFADRAVAKGGDVLFMSERHLLTFGLIEDVPLVHDYEKMLLQEMAMGSNQAYLDAFAEDMAAQSYAMIVTDRLPGRLKDPATESLAMENNVVYQHVVPLIACAYELRTRLLDNRLEVWLPKAVPTCPAN